MNFAAPFMATMDLLKLQAVATLVFIALDMPLPWLPASIAFFAAMVLARVMRRIGSRLVPRVIVNLLGAALSVAAIHAAGIAPAGFALSYLVVSSIMGCAFWIRGAWLGSRDPDHAFCLARFEEGIGVFLVVFFMASPSRIDMPVAAGLSIPFFMCGILALGISRAGKAANGGFAGRQGGATLVPAAAAFTLASIGLFIVIPALQLAAERTRDAMKDGSIELIRLLGVLLSRLFRLRPVTTEYAGGGDSPLPAPGEASAQPGLLVKILMLASLAAVLATVIAIMAVMIARFVRALASRPRERGEPLDLSFLPDWLRALALAVARAASRTSAWIGKILGRRRRRSAAIAAYARLLACGRSAGAPRRSTETPREYSRRLVLRFPRAAGTAMYVVEALELEVYGGKAPDSAAVRRLLKARRLLRPVSFMAERVRTN